MVCQRRSDSRLNTILHPPHRTSYTHDSAGIELSLARFDVAEASSLALVDALHAHWRAHLHLPGFRYWLATFCWNAGVVPVGAYLDLHNAAAMMHKVYKTLRAHGFHALICLEVEILMRLEGEDSARLMYHIHAPCWRYDAWVQPRLLAAAMMAGDRFPNDLGAPGVMFTTHRHPKAPPGLLLGDDIMPRARAPLSTASVAGLAGYVTKWPVCVKVRRA